MQSLKAVFFDFGGTLFSYHSIGRSSGKLVRDLARRAGYTGNDFATVGAAYARSTGGAFHAFADRPFYLHKDVFHDGFRRFASELGLDADDGFIDYAYTELQGWMVSSFALRDGCRDVLQALRERGLYLSIVSNIDDEFLHPMVERSGLRDILDDWTSSEEARSCKPDAGFFRVALAKAGCRAEEVLFVGDSPEHDIAGARPLGMHTALIVDVGVEPPGNRGDMAESLTRADHVIQSLDELIGIVDAGLSAGADAKS